MGSPVTHSPTVAILMPAAVAEAKSKHVSGCQGSIHSDKVVLDKVRMDHSRTRKARVFLVGVAD